MTSVLPVILVGVRHCQIGGGRRDDQHGSFHV